MFSKLLSNGSSKPFKSDCATSIVFNSLGKFKVLVSANASGTVGVNTELACTLAYSSVIGAAAAGELGTTDVGAGVTV